MSEIQDSPATHYPATHGTLLIDFRGPQGPLWESVDDDVMGGHSRSRMFRTERHTGLFQGTVVVEDGGFASVVAELGDLDLSRLSGVELQCRGDGKSYQLRLRDSSSADGLWYQVEVTTTDEWRSLVFDFSEFTATRRGKSIAHANALDVTRIAAIGLLIAGQAGTFECEVREVLAVSRSAVAVEADRDRAEQADALGGESSADRIAHSDRGSLTRGAMVFDDDQNEQRPEGET